MYRENENIHLTGEESRLSGLPLVFPASRAAFYLMLVEAVVDRKLEALQSHGFDSGVGNHLSVLRPLAYHLSEVVVANQVIAEAESFLRPDDSTD